MRKKILAGLGWLLILNTAQLYGMDQEQKEKGDLRRHASSVNNTSLSLQVLDPEPHYSQELGSYISKNAFVTGSTIIFGWLCERWTVDAAARIIQNIGTSSKSPFYWLLASAIRGKSLQDALPIAQKQGNLIGMLAAGLVAPMVWDCGSAVLQSSGKIHRWIFDDDTPESQIPTKRDCLKVGLSSVAVFFTARFVYRQL